MFLPHRNNSRYKYLYYIIIYIILYYIIMSITMFDYTQIINHLYPDSIFTISGNDYSTLLWSTNNVDTKPTESEIITKNTSNSKPAVGVSKSPMKRQKGKTCLN